MARSAFKFRMQRLLDVRVMREKLAQSELLELQRKAEVERQKLVQIQAEEQRLRQAQARPLERGEDLQKWADERVWLEKSIKANVEQEQPAQQSQIAAADQRVVAQQAVLKQRGIDVKALEKVRENQGEEHRLDQLREEGLFMDDLAGQGYLRRRGISERVAAEDAEYKSNEGATP